MQLFINTYGTYVHVKDEMFEIRVPGQGNEKEYQRHHFSAQKVSSILMPKSVALSTDAVILALKHNVDILFVDYDGHPLGRVWHSKLGSTTRIRKAQLEASLGADGLHWVKEWVSVKMENQMQMIQNLAKHRAPVRAYINQRIEQMQSLHVSLCQLIASQVQDVAETIRGLEGTSGRVYFEVLSAVLSETYTFSGRSSRPAKDPFNAFLNYAYGILYGKVEKSLIIAGLDPYLGFLHRDDYNQLSMVYDFIEPYRIYCDTVVFRLFTSKKVNKAHTEKITNGYSLNKEGKELLVHAFNNYFDVDTIRYKGRNQTRSNSIQMDAHTFANKLLKQFGKQTDRSKIETL